MRGDRTIVIETYGLLDNLIKAVNCFTPETKDGIKISIGDLAKILDSFRCNEDNEIITNWGDEGITSIVVYESSICMDKLRESHLEWYYSEEE